MKGFLFFIFFTLEVQVHASTLVRSPEACDGSDGPCVIKSISQGNLELKLPGNKTVRMTPTSFLRITYGSIKFLKGEFILECKSFCQVSSLLIGQIQVTEGSVYIHSRLRNTKVFALDGSIQQSFEKEGEFLLLPGMVQNVSANKGHFQSVEMPQIVSDEELMTLVPKLAKNPLHLMRALRAKKIVAAGYLSEGLKQNIERKIASDKEERRLRALRRREYEAESRRLRAIFRKKNYMSY